MSVLSIYCIGFSVKNEQLNFDKENALNYTSETILTIH